MVASSDPPRDGGGPDAKPALRIRAWCRAKYLVTASPWPPRDSHPTPPGQGSLEAVLTRPLDGDCFRGDRRGHTTLISEEPEIVSCTFGDEDGLAVAQLVQGAVGSWSGPRPSDGLRWWRARLPARPEVCQAHCFHARVRLGGSFVKVRGVGATFGTRSQVPPAVFGSDLHEFASLCCELSRPSKHRGSRGRTHRWPRSGGDLFRGGAVDCIELSVLAPF